MLDQNACRFYGRIAYDRNYNGLALDDDEGERVAKLMQDGKSILFMGNHGIMVMAPTIAQAFDDLYYLEKAAQVQVLALQTGRDLAIIPDEIAARAEQQQGMTTYRCRRKMIALNTAALQSKEEAIVALFQ